ncbi:MAG: hypothetical protein ACXV4B_08525 [Halobacteriota archaeon]
MANHAFDLCGERCGGHGCTARGGLRQSAGGADPRATDHGTGGIATALPEVDDLPRHHLSERIIAVDKVKGMQRVFTSAAQVFDLVRSETLALQ